MKTLRRFLFVLLFAVPVLFADSKDKKPAPPKKDFLGLSPRDLHGENAKQGIYAFRL